MCATCGCGEPDGAVITLPGEHRHDHPHEHVHDHSPDHEHHHHHHHETMTLEQKVLARNDEVADANRDWLVARKIVALNLMGSPGAGKTTLLERTIVDNPDLAVAVIEGDQETTLDADRISAAGATVVQVNTGSGCHLDAEMVRGSLATLDPPRSSLLFVENVGNLVCPALFDLGENAKVVTISVTEGSDKPRKYPHMFAAADLILINKIDLLPYVDFDVAACERFSRSINPSVEVLAVSARTGEGLANWYGWITAGARR